jgi:hypothetical protein
MMNSLLFVIVENDMIYEFLVEVTFLLMLFPL